MSRFERKILIAMLLVALTPLIASVYFGRAMLQDAYRIGVNQKFATQIEETVDVRKEYVQALRREVELRVDYLTYRLTAIAQKNRGNLSIQEFAQEVLKEGVVAHANLIAKDGSVVAHIERANVDTNARLSVLSRELVIGSQSYQLDVAIFVPQRDIDRFQKAGSVAEVYSRLFKRSARVSSIYVWLFVGLTTTVILIALVIAIILSRRVTARVTTLEKATRRVGAGDLSVSVPAGPGDEVGELIGAFNAMVSDLRESRDRINYLQKISAWQEFARRLAHEIKNPLTPIQLAAQEMAQTYKGDDEHFAQKLKSARVIIEDEVATLRRLVGEFSDFAKLPQAKLIQGDLNHVLQTFGPNVDAILSDAQTDSQHVQVRVEQAPQPVEVMMDPMMLKRCLDNLVRNAAQAIANSDNPQGEILIKLSTQGARAFLEIRDNGPGIPRESRDRVFDPYFTTKNEGTGLGLPIVKKVILEHGGDVRLKETPEGACFMIELPTVTDRYAS